MDVFTKSFSGSTLDEMILLLHYETPNHQRWVPQHVRTVMYEDIEEIPDCIRAKATGRVGVREPADPPLGSPTTEGHPDGDGQQKHSDLPEDVLGQSDGEPPVDNGNQKEASASPEEIRAVLTIETAYYRATRRKKEVLKGVDATRVRLWSFLRDRASSMEWPRHKQYRLPMQGPLVHVLVCLDGIKAFADQTIRELKKQPQGDDHTRLEEPIERSDWFRWVCAPTTTVSRLTSFTPSDLRRAAAVLQAKLGHSSSLHSHRNVSALKAAVLEVEGLIGRLSEFSGPAAMRMNERIEEDWKLGWDGIVKGPVGARNV